MRCQRDQYIEEYQSVLVKLKEAQEDHFPEELDNIVELRRSLNELVALARRSLSEKESKLFKRACEEIEDCILLN